MKRVLLDTSVIVSGLAFVGFPGMSLKITVENLKIKAYVSRTILEKLKELLARTHLLLIPSVNALT